MTAPAVSAVCVSYNCADLLRVTLASLARQDVPGGMEIVVVDNASRDDSAAAAAEFEGVTVIPLEENVGFGAANNVGARRAGGELLLFANPDVDVPAGVVSALVELMSKNSEAVAAGPRTVDREGRLQKFCARKFPRLINMIFLVSGVGETRWAGSPLAHRFYPPAYYGRGPAEAEVLAGAFMLVRRRAFEAIGGFDEGYFLYGEDVDLCRRLWREGAVWYVPVGPVRHFTGGSRTAPDPVVTIESHRSAARYAELWLGRGAGAMVRLCSAASLRARRVLFVILGLAWKRARTRARYYADVLKGMAAKKAGAAGSD
jgi:GT2 family glycosyltransferase